MKKTNLIFTLIAASMLLASCGKSSANPTPTDSTPDTTDTTPGTDTNSDTDTSDISDGKCYEGSTWNSNFINNVFADFPEYQDIFPVYETASGNFEFTDGTEENDGDPYLQLYVYNTNYDEVKVWLDDMDNGDVLYGDTVFFGDESSKCDNNNLCETGYDSFVHHKSELYFDEDMVLFVLVTNEFDATTPRVGIEIMYWPDAI